MSLRELLDVQKMFVLMGLGTEAERQEIKDLIKFEPVPKLEDVYCVSLTNTTEQVEKE